MSPFRILENNLLLASAISTHVSDKQSYLESMISCLRSCQLMSSSRPLMTSRKWKHCWGLIWGKYALCSEIQPWQAYCRWHTWACTSFICDINTTYLGINWTAGVKFSHNLRKWLQTFFFFFCIYIIYFLVQCTLFTMASFVPSHFDVWLNLLL